MSKVTTIDLNEEQGVWMLDAYEAWTVREIGRGVTDLDDLTAVLDFRKVLIKALKEVSGESTPVVPESEPVVPESAPAVPNSVPVVPEEEEPIRITEEDEKESEPSEEPAEANEELEPTEKLGGDEREAGKGFKAEDSRP